MAVKRSTPASKSKAPAAPTARQAWQEVLARMSDLGDAMEQWTKAAASEADTKQKLEQVREGINEIAQRADTALGRAESELGQRVNEGAEQAGRAFSAAAQRIREATEPHVRDALADLSNAFGKAAATMGDSSAAQPTSPPRSPKASDKNT